MLDLQGNVDGTLNQQGVDKDRKEEPPPQPAARIPSEEMMKNTQTRRLVQSTTSRGIGDAHLM
jgi:hypothetical protein